MHRSIMEQIDHAQLLSDLANVKCSRPRWQWLVFVDQNRNGSKMNTAAVQGLSIIIVVVVVVML